LALVGFQCGGLFCLRRSYDFSRPSGAGEAITLESDQSVPFYASTYPFKIALGTHHFEWVAA
jgi:hypothetical protein